MWASLKNYSIIPKGGLGGHGANKCDGLPFSSTFSLTDQKELLRKARNTTTTHSPQRQQAARRKLMLALTEDADCFRYFQSQLRQLGVTTNVATEQLLRNDTGLLKKLSDKVISKGERIALSKELQVEHHIVSKATVNAAYYMEGGGMRRFTGPKEIHSLSNTGSSLLHNLKGLIIQQEDEDDEDNLNSGELKEPSSMRAPKYVVVSSPPTSQDYSKCASKTGATGNCALPKFLSVTTTRPTNNTCGTIGSNLISAKNQRVFGPGGGNGGINRRQVRAVSTASNSTPTPSPRGSITARGSLASAAEWLSHTTVLPTVLRSNASEPVAVSPSRASWQNNNPDKQINMSSRQMSESLQNSLQHVDTHNNDTSVSMRGTSSSAMAEFHECSSSLRSRSISNLGSLMHSFGDSQEIDVPIQEEALPSPRKAKSRSALKSVLSRAQAAHLGSSMHKKHQDYHQDCDNSITGMTVTTENDAQDQAQVQSNFNDFLTRSNVDATQLNDACDSDNDDDQSALLVGFPSKAEVQTQSVPGRRRRDSRHTKMLMEHEQNELSRSHSRRCIRTNKSKQQGHDQDPQEPKATPLRLPTSTLRAARGA